MEENAAVLHTVVNSVQALGKGFDVNFDTRLLYCKGVAGSKVVEIDEEHTRDVWIYDNLVVPKVSRDIESSQDEVNRDSSGVCNYHQVYC
ncbi:putative MACPF domain-containing protein CAD1/NSL1 [Helianthus annuus]|nr:putative MACPF domain-containing protein CAD1/NSL1 [Helianthus annuus]